MKILFALFLVSITVRIHAQVRVSVCPGGFLAMGYTVGPANKDPYAQTPEQINAINLKLADEGNTDADFQLGLAYMQGFGVTANRAKAEHYFEIGAVSPSDKSLVATFYRTGGFFPCEPETAVKWYLAAGRSGDLFEAAKLYGLTTPPQYIKATAIYRDLLKQPESAEYRRAQMELGNLVLDGKYNAGDDAVGRAMNLEWARMITQELLGQVEYTIAVAYDAKVEGVPKDKKMWQHFCQRAAAYNNDLAQQFLGSAILDRTVPSTSLLEGYAWLRLSSNKRYQNRDTVKTLEAGMNSAVRLQADSYFEGLIQTRLRDGAYYTTNDPLQDPSAAELAALPDDDPDVQVRRAFHLEKTGIKADYEQAMRLYRIARDRREMDIRLVLGRDYLVGSNGVSKNAWLAKHWLMQAANAGSRPAGLYLAKWYRGEGGGDVDPAMAYAWGLLGTETGSPPSSDSLTVAQKQAAELQIKSWRATHSGW